MQSVDWKITRKFHFDSLGTFRREIDEIIFKRGRDATEQPLRVVKHPVMNVGAALKLNVCLNLKRELN